VHRNVIGRVGAVAGLAGVAGNVVGVAVLGGIPSAYRPGTLAAWASEILAAPDAAAASAIGFTLGLIALAVWAVAIGILFETALARLAGAGIAVGALLNAAGTPSQFVVAKYLGPVCGTPAECVPAAIALLGLSLTLDATFNLLLGIGLVSLAAAVWHRVTSPRWLPALMLVAGLSSIPVSLQIVSETAANLLMVAGPLWLAAITVSTLPLWRGRL
jgi:hypothetical protein